MCQFLSLVSDGKGRAMYFDAAMRQRILAGETKYQDTDSHTSIADFYGYQGRDEDKLNKYEYNPLTNEFTVDQLNTTNDSGEIRRFCLALDFGTIVPELVIKPIIHPFNDIQVGPVTEETLALLRRWASVGASVGPSVGPSVGASVRASVRASVGPSVGASVWASVGTSVGDSVGASVGASVWTSVWDSVWDSVWAIVWAYCGSFFKLPAWQHIIHEPGEYPFSPAVELWERGFVPSFNGEAWRLHAGKGAKVVWEEQINE